MAITIELMDGKRISIERGSATIGRGPGADIIVRSPELQPIHAKIVQVAGRWMIESAGDWSLQVGDNVPGRRQWLEPDQVIRLTESGVRVVFQPPERRIPVSQPSKADVAPTSTAKTKATSSCTFLPPPIPSHTNSPALPDGFYQSGELPTPPPLPVELNTTNTPAVPAEPPASDQWYYCDGNQQEGPVSFDHMKYLASTGSLRPGHFVWKQGMSQWTEAWKSDGLFPVVPAADSQVPPPIPTTVVSSAPAVPALASSTANLTGDAESLRQYLCSLKTLRFSFPVSLFRSEMLFTNEDGKTVLYVSKDGIMKTSMTLWRDSTKTLPLLRISKHKGSITGWNVASVSGEKLSSLKFSPFVGWTIQLPDGTIITPVNRLSVPKLCLKVATMVLSAGVLLLAILLLNPKPLWSVLSVGNTFSFMARGQELCSVRKLGGLFNVYYQVDDLSSVAKWVDPTVVVAALAMEAAAPLMTM